MASPLVYLSNLPVSVNADSLWSWGRMLRLDGLARSRLNNSILVMSPRQLSVLAHALCASYSLAFLDAAHELSPNDSKAMTIPRKLKVVAGAYVTYARTKHSCLCLRRVPGGHCRSNTTTVSYSTHASVLVQEYRVNSV